MPTTNVTWLANFEPSVWHPVLDSTANLAANLVTGEVHTITPVPSARGAQFIVPIFAPFYGRDLALIHIPTSGPQRTLVEGVDYYKAFEFYGASMGLGFPVYGGIGFINNQLSGQIRVAYRTIGGTWCLARPKINEILTNLIVNPRVVYWDQVAGYPSIFPPINHDYNIEDMVGLGDLVISVNAVAAAIAAIPAPVVNPQYVAPTKATVGLSEVNNYATATPAEAITGTASNLYLTPQGARAAILAAQSNVPMAVSDDEQNRSRLGSDNKIYTPELQIRPSQYFKEKTQPLAAYITPTDDGTTEAKLTEFAYDVGTQVFNLFTNQGLLPNLITQDKTNLVAAINEVMRESALKTLSYVNRRSLRTTVPLANGAVMVEGLGLFYHQADTTEPDDDESCFRTSTGAWLLMAMSWDLFDAWTMGERDASEQRLQNSEGFKNRFVQGKGTSSITGILSKTSASFLVLVPGAKFNESAAFAQTTGIVNPRITSTAKVIALGVVEVTLSNPSEFLATLIDGEVWQVLVVNSV